MYLDILKGKYDLYFNELLTSFDNFVKLLNTVSTPFDEENKNFINRKKKDIINFKNILKKHILKIPKLEEELDLSEVTKFEIYLDKKHKSVKEFYIKFMIFYLQYKFESFKHNDIDNITDINELISELDIISNNSDLPIINKDHLYQIKTILEKLIDDINYFNQLSNDITLINNLSLASANNFFNHLNKSNKLYRSCKSNGVIPPDLNYYYSLLKASYLTHHNILGLENEFTKWKLLNLEINNIYKICSGSKFNKTKYNNIITDIIDLHQKIEQIMFYVIPQTLDNKSDIIYLKEINYIKNNIITEYIKLRNLVESKIINEKIEEHRFPRRSKAITVTTEGQGSIEAVKNLIKEDRVPKKSKRKKILPQAQNVNSKNLNVEKQAIENNNYQNENPDSEYFTRLLTYAKQGLVPYGVKFEQQNLWCSFLESKLGKDETQSSQRDLNINERYMKNHSWIDSVAKDKKKSNNYIIDRVN